MSQLPPPNYAPLDPEAYKHQATLLKALHSAHPVIVDGRAGFIQGLYPQLTGGRVGMIVYLTGDPVPIDAPLVSLHKQPE